MSRMKKAKLPNEYVQVPNVTAKAVEVATESQTISLGALGLIVNLWSYDVENWELHKTELYKRFGKNGERSVKTCWDELIEADYIIEFKYRAGSKWEYEYYYRILPFTKEEKDEYLAESLAMYGEISRLQNAVPKNEAEKNGDCKMKSPKSRLQNVEISNIQLKKYKLTKDYKDLDPNPNQKREQTEIRSLEQEKPFKTEKDVHDLKLPVRIKKLIYDNDLYGYGQGQGNYNSLNPLDIEKFYTTSPYVKETASKYDPNFINEYDFYDIVKAIIERVDTPIKRHIGILNNFTLRKLSYKSDYNDYLRDVEGFEPTDNE